jgi:hypothetical protein
MIRRTFWITVGAAGGIMGYRRVASLGRRTALAGQRAGQGAGQRAAKQGWARRAIRFSRDARSFTRDVREGMDLYIARHPGAGTPTLGASERTNVKDDR